MDFASWPEHLKKIDTYSLDPENPRIPDPGAPMSDRDIIAALIEFEDLYEFTKKVAKSGGLYPHESLIVVVEGGKKVVVEGNRRLAALMVLNNPDLVPDDAVKKFKSLREQIAPQAIEKVRVVTAPSREAAAPLILARHSGDAVRRWQMGQQAKYIRSLLSPGSSVKDLSERIGISESDIVKSLRLNTMYHLAQIMSLDPATQAVVANPHAFSLSTLERLIDAPSTLSTLGISFTKEGEVVGTVDSDEFKKGYTRIVTDIVKGPANGGIDTRSLNKRADIDGYLKRLGKDRPDHKKKGVFTSASLLVGAPVKVSAGTGAKKKAAGPSLPRDSKYLPPSDFRLPTKNPRVKEVFKEFRRLKVDDFTATCGVMLRVFFELLLTNHLDKTKKMQTLVKDLQTSGKVKGNVATFHPSMTQMMKFIQSDQSITLPPQIRKALNRMIDNADSFLSFDEINGFVHNSYVGPKENELRKIWHILDPLMTQLTD